MMLFEHVLFTSFYKVNVKATFYTHQSISGSGSCDEGYNLGIPENMRCRIYMHKVTTI